MLNENRYVAFCGTPCQVAALNSYLGHKSFEKLITIDFICRGVNSPKAFKAWLNEIENSNNSKVVKVWFKYKEVDGKHLQKEHDWILKMVILK